ncbi:M56 family metallopeptidase [Tunturiibacter lichenicola]|uniref:M56 family metallopeptidase n=1 Tax=Tunturiibacter lichenicola TaxID=2051959 RepID=UPI003D9BB168
MAMDLSLLHDVEGLSRMAASSVVSGIWQGAVLAAGVGICLRLVPKTTAAIRFALWTVVFAILVVLPLLHAYGFRAGSEMAGHGAIVQVDPRWSFAIAALWVVASLVRAVKLVVGGVQLRWVWKRATPVEAGPGSGCEAALALAGSRGVTLCTSTDVDRPSVIGFFSPRILIPREVFERVTAAELKQIVLHEVGHLRRHDDWINLLQKVSLVLVPLNPALLWIEKRLCFERELACDDDVLRLTKAPKAYATCLTSLAEERLGRRAAALSLGAWERRSELSRRVHRILSWTEGMSRTRAYAVMSVVTLGLIGGAAGLSRCPQFVSFSGGAVAQQAAVQSLPSAGYPSAGYQDVVFHPAVASSVSGAPHETLLKASMPVDSSHRALPPTKRVAAKAHRSAPKPILMRAKQNRAMVQGPQQLRRWVVLTAWDGSARARMMLTVSSEPEVSSSYAAVPTPDGWLVIQL